MALPRHRRARRARPGRRGDRRRDARERGDAERARLATLLDADAARAGPDARRPPHEVLDAAHSTRSREATRGWSSPSSTTSSASSTRSISPAPPSSAATGSDGRRCRSRRSPATAASRRARARSSPAATTDDAEAGAAARPWPRRFGVTRFGELDEHLFAEGRHARLYDKLGAHQMAVDGTRGPTSRCGRRTLRGSRSSGTSTAGTGIATRSRAARRSGIWEGFVPDVGRRGALQVPPRVDARRRGLRQGGPVRARAPSSRRSPRRSRTTPAHALARPRVDVGARGRAATPTSRSRSTRCTSARGARPRGGERAPDLSRARAAPDRARSRRTASPTSSSCR